MCFSHPAIREESSSASSGPSPAVRSSSRSILRGQVCFLPHQTTSSLAAKRMYCLQVFGPMEIMAPPTVHSVWLQPQLPAKLRCPQTCWPHVGMLMDVFSCLPNCFPTSLADNYKGICTFSFCDCEGTVGSGGKGGETVLPIAQKTELNPGASVFPLGPRTLSCISSPSLSRQSLGKGQSEHFLPKLPFEMLTFGKRHYWGTSVPSETELNHPYYFMCILVPFHLLLLAKPPHLESHLFLNMSGEGTAVGGYHACKGLTLRIACLSAPAHHGNHTGVGSDRVGFLFCFVLFFMLPNCFVRETGVCLLYGEIKPVRF